MAGAPLAGSVALVTGASRGLGREIARALWRRGASLVLVARSEENLRAVAEELRSARASPRDDRRVTVVGADLASDQALPRIMEGVAAAGGTVDILVNNAAITGPVGPVWLNDWEEWTRTLRINLLTPVALCQVCVPPMRARRRGKIINLSGGGATSPRPFFSAYATAKTGLVRFSETLAHEVRADNIQVNCVAPGAMNTDMLREIVRAGVDRVGSEEVAQARREAERGDAAVRRAAELCAYLASAASDRITGRLISAVWDRWGELAEHGDALETSDIYTLRRIVPRDRGADWG